MKDDISRLDIYRRILAHDPGDGKARSHRQTQPGKPRQARLWLVWSRRYQAVAPLVAHDERFEAKAGAR